jgi:lipopolysaccharide export system protein LptA
MEAESKKDIIIFIGNVVANRGKMQIKADRLEVFIKKKRRPEKGSGKAAGAATKKGAGMSSQGDIERIVAIGNVLLRQDGDKFASGERMVYHEARGVAVLSGNPRAWEGKNQIIGDRIELYLREDRTVVLGSPSRRVGVTLYPANENASVPQQ